jgi:hypothetical protein
MPSLPPAREEVGVPAGNFGQAVVSNRPSFVDGIHYRGNHVQELGWALESACRIFLQENDNRLGNAFKAFVR